MRWGVVVCFFGGWGGVVASVLFVSHVEGSQAQAEEAIMEEQYAAVTILLLLSAS